MKKTKIIIPAEDRNLPAAEIMKKYKVSRATAYLVKGGQEYVWAPAPKREIANKVVVEAYTDEMRYRIEGKLANYFGQQVDMDTIKDVVSDGLLRLLEYDLENYKNIESYWTSYSFKKIRDLLKRKEVTQWS